jgi:NADH-quinone oxidoreductase subunit M
MPIEFLRVLLLVLLGLPLLGALAVAALGANRQDLIRRISLVTSLVALLLAAVLAANFATIQAGRTDTRQADTFAPEIVPGADDTHPHATHWELLRFGSLGAVQFYLGLDGLNVWLVVLTALLMVSGVLVSWTAVTERVNEYYAWLLALETAMLGVFLAFDIIVFYIFFELTLVPLFFLIGIWGGSERRYAARKFFLFTLAGSLITLLGVLAVVVKCYIEQPPGLQTADRLTFSLPELVSRMHALLGSATDLASWQTFQFWVFLALMTGFAVKVPLVPFHTWLPLAHTEAPTAGSVLLAGVLLKVGAYGFLRLCLPLAPDACLSVGLPLIGGLAVFGIIYGALCSLVQPDIKKMIAYSSVSHLGFCMLGMFALNATGLAGSLLQMINHGLSTGALFLLIGMLYERYHTRQINDYSGMGAKLGLLSCFMVFTCLTSVGLPFLNGFVGEALVFLGMIDVRPGLAIVGTAGIVLGAWYLLTMLMRVFFGPLKEPHHEGHAVGDLNGRELATLVPIAALCILLGVYPQPVLDTSRADLERVARLIDQRRQRLEEYASTHEVRVARSSDSE